jgi:hypothetical protein
MKLRVAIFSLILLLPGLMRAQEAAEDIRDVKELITIPAPPNYWLGAVVCVVLLIAGYLLWKWLNQKVAAPGISAAKRALDQLHSAERLIHMDSAEPLVVKATDAIRNYIESRFSLAAPRQTTEEFLRKLQETNDGLENPPSSEISRYRDELGNFLTCCDKVKFGRGDLVAQDRSALLESARQFINTTQDSGAG